MHHKVPTDAFNIFNSPVNVSKVDYIVKNENNFAFKTNKFS